MTDKLDAVSLRVHHGALKENLRVPARRMSTGFELVDAKLSDGGSDTGGFQRPSLVILGAEPKIGKSMLAQQIGQRHVELSDDNYTYYVDMENGIQRFHRRLVCRLAGLTGAELAAGLSDEVERRLVRADKWLATKGERYMYQPSRRLTHVKLAQECRMMRANWPNARILVVLDSLQKMPMDLIQRRAGMDEWLRLLEELRDENDLVLLAISELKRPALGSGKKYRAGGLAYKESGDIEYTGDLLLSLERRDPKSRVVTLVAEWNRDGPTGDLCQLVPNSDYTKFIERELPEGKGE